MGLFHTLNAVFDLHDILDRHVAVGRLLGCTLQASLISGDSGVSTRQHLHHVDPNPF